VRLEGLGQLKNPIGSEMHTILYLETVKRRDHMGDLGERGRIILKRVIQT
jgi:hypothetical protein